MKIKVKHILFIIIIFGMYYLINMCNCNDTFVIGVNPNNEPLCNYFKTYPRDETISSSSARQLCDASKFCEWKQKHFYNTKSCHPIEDARNHLYVWCRRHIGPDEKNKCKNDDDCVWVKQSGGMRDARCVPISASNVPLSGYDDKMI